MESLPFPGQQVILPDVKPALSERFATRVPSAIRTAQIRHARRTGDVDAVNTAIGNVSLPMHPAMKRRLSEITSPGSPFADGVVKYTPTVGTNEANAAFLNTIASLGYATDGLYSMITGGGSPAMELAILGVAGPPGTDERPLLMIDATYTNYAAYCGRLGRRGVAVVRSLADDGTFSLPALSEIEALIERERPGALLVIPYDNPTGHFYPHHLLLELARLCVKYNMWMVSDEAYRALFYVPDERTSSVWAITETEVPGITGRRISIETTSKVWNACGLRIGALVTDSEEFHRRAVAEYTTDLCANAIGQYIFGAIARETHADLRSWYKELRDYYAGMMFRLADEITRCVPGVIISRPDASIYSVVDVRNATAPGFDAAEFVEWCAGEGTVDVDGRATTLLVAPMSGFYADEENNPGKTQMRIAYVEPADRMALVPRLFAELFSAYEAARAVGR